MIWHRAASIFLPPHISHSIIHDFRVSLIQTKYPILSTAPTRLGILKSFITLSISSRQPLFCQSLTWGLDPWTDPSAPNMVLHTMASGDLKLECCLDWVHPEGINIYFGFPWHCRHMYTLWFTKTIRQSSSDDHQGKSSPYFTEDFDVLHLNVGL